MDRTSKLFMIDQNEAQGHSGVSLASAVINFLQGDITRLTSYNDSDKIAQFILYHGLSTHTYHKLIQNNLLGNLTDRIKSHYYTISIRNAQIFETFRVIVDLFEQNNITYMPLKGSFLLPIIYNDTSGRAISDLDILIHPCDYPKVQQTLIKRGAIQEVENETVLLQELGHHYAPFTLFNTSIEIHTRLFPKNMKYQIPIESVWSNKELYHSNGKKVFGVNHNQLIAYLALHIHYSEMRGEYRLYWYLDLYKLISRNTNPITLDLITFLKSQRIEKPVLKILSRVAYLFNLNLPFIEPLSLKETRLFANGLGGVDKRINKGYSIVFERILYTKGWIDKYRYLRDTVMHKKVSDSGKGIYSRVTKLIKNTLFYWFRK